MEICRICLENKKNLCSVFDSKDGISYADMIESVIKIKIIRDYDKNNLCLQCSRKLQNFYNFKQQIERSERLLHEHLRIFSFENVDDLKAKLIGTFNITACESINTGIRDKIESYIRILQNGSDNLLYNNTVIKKIFNTEVDEEEFLNDNNYESEDEPLQNFKETTTEVKLQETKNNNKISKSKKICIRPKYLNNLRILRYPKRESGKPKKYKNRKKLRKMCPHCGIMCTNINSHVMKHTAERKYKCSDCQKTFFTSKDLNRHEKLHLSNISFKCDHCVAVFKDKYTLKSHMITHTNEKKHVCSVCNKAFKRTATLQRHKLIHSSAAKSVMCEFCNMSFRHKEGLKHHMRVHTGERPFKCEICSQPYSYKIDFNRHCLKKHGVVLKRRSVHVLTEEVLVRERKLMKDLMFKLKGVVTEGEPVNPFQGPQAAQAFEYAVKALKSNEIPIDVMI